MQDNNNPNNIISENAENKLAGENQTKAEKPQAGAEAKTEAKIKATAAETPETKTEAEKATAPGKSKQAETPTKTQIQTPPQTQAQTQIMKLGRGLVFSILILSILAGAVAGFAGGFVFAGGMFAAKGAPAKTVSVQEDSDIINVVKKASPAVVSIIISKDLQQANNSDPFSNPFFFDPFFQNRQQQQGSNAQPTYQEVGAGSGFFITASGLILTNKHVVADTQAKYTVITSDGKEYDASVVARDPINDLALVKINIQNAPVLQLADSSNLQIGQRVIAIGDSLGEYSNTVTTGIVSGIGRNVTAGGEGTSEQLEGVIQTDAAINPGNSGGPLLDIQGQVIGVNTAIDEQGQLVGFAIPSNDAAKDVQSYDSYGEIIKPFLGVRYVMITPDIQKQQNLPVGNGAWITSNYGINSSSEPAVVPGSAADKAGLKDGDIIISVNGAKIDARNTLTEVLKNFNPGETIHMSVLRGGKAMDVAVTLGEKK